MSLKGVIYARYSSTNQREESIEGQLRECMAFAKYKDIDILTSYIDRAITGKTDARPQFQQMVLDSSKHVFDVVIVYTLDRFARNRYDSAVYKAKLKKNGVKVLSAKENITDDPSGILLEAMLEGYAEYYSAELAQKVKRGMTENAMAGKWQAHIPLGYVLDQEKRLQVNENTAPIVRLIFELYVAGHTSASIIRTLNAKHFYTSQNKFFKKSSLESVISNVAYMGTYKWNDIVIPDAVPALVSKEVFEQAQQRLNSQRGKKHVRTSEFYLLTTKLKCGQCGSNMIGMSGKSRNGEIHYYYVCQNKRSHGTCKARNIRKEDVEDAVINNAVRILQEPGIIELIADQSMAALKASENPELAVLRAQETDLKAKIENCLQAIEQGFFSPALGQRLKGFEKEADAVHERLEKLQLEEIPFTVTRERIIYFLNHALRQTEKKRREFIISTLVNEVTLEFDASTGTYFANITYNLSEPKPYQPSGFKGGSQKSKLVHLNSTFANISALFVSSSSFGFRVAI